MGRNGSGKTTTLRLLLGLLQPDRGRARVLGWDFWRAPRSVRTRVAYVSQTQQLPASRSLEELNRCLKRFNEQWDPKDSSGTVIARELVAIVKSLDTTRPTVSALSNPYPVNPLVKADALDLIGYNYDNKDLPDFHTRFPGKKFLGTETVSALETRGFYDFSVPTDSIRRWPERWDKRFTGGFIDHSVSAYDNVSAPWGGTHEETWKMFKKYDFLSGQYIWTGFDYIGEPTPYEWPSRSSYFGIIDLAGFPKDVYYMYQGEWTDKPVLHLLPDSWNWKNGDVIDVWAYYNNADEVELYLNDKSLGVRKKQNDDLHVEWKGVFVHQMRTNSCGFVAHTRRVWTEYAIIGYI